MNTEEKLSLVRNLMWDYDISPQDCLALLEGKLKYAGHYSEELLFKKMLESFPWYTIMDLLPLKRIQYMLTDNIINKLRTEQLKKRYAFIRSRLSETI